MPKTLSVFEPRRTAPVVRQFVAHMATVLGLSLLLAGTELAALTGRMAQQEAPSGLGAVVNAPGAITLTWTHSGEDLFGFVLEQETPYAARALDPDKRIWTVVSLQPGTAYRFRVCAVYAFNRVCSEYVPATTLPPGNSPPAKPPAYVAPSGSVSFQSHNYPDRFIRHLHFLGALAPQRTITSRGGATFFIRAGLSGTPNAVSLESANLPGHFLRHGGYRIRLAKNDGTDLFRKDASFFMREYDSVDRGNWYFESVNFPNHYIRHTNFELWLVRTDRSQQMLLDMLFRQRPAQ